MRKLLGNGHDVICIDNFFTSNKNNVRHLLNNNKFELMRHDITFPIYLEIDQIYNLACPASPIHYQYPVSDKNQYTWFNKPTRIS